MQSSVRSLSGTARRILDVAERLVQSQGFNGFSYADISAQLGITKASLHYHFPTKADLGATLIVRYGDTFKGALTDIDREETSPPRKLQRYADLYADVLRKNRMCLCGMLAAEHSTLPREMKDLVKAFFDANEGWLAAVLEQGRKSKSLRFSGLAIDEARLLLGALEGAMLVARSYDDAPRFTAAAAHLLAQLAPKPR